MRPLLIIGHTFPEPATTAAGWRMMQLISVFQDAGFPIVFASASDKTPYSSNLEKLGVEVVPIKLNHSSFDDFIVALQPAIVVFDRFMTEEQYGWRVAEQCPKALRILDTEDLHFLRKAREAQVKAGSEEIDLYTEVAKREVASIYRCDLSIIISEAEMKLLTDSFHVPESILCYFPLCSELAMEDQKPTYKERAHFITAGNYMHAPNADAIRYLKKELWPEIREALPEAELHIYGAYIPKQITDFDNPGEGFLVKGWVEDLAEVVQAARVCLAPLRFGAGLKGKIIQAFQHGTPVVSTAIGFEGIPTSELRAKTLGDSPSNFIERAIRLYSEETTWNLVSSRQLQIVTAHFSLGRFSKQFQNQLNELQTNLEIHRKRNFTGQMLQHHSLQSTKYLSKWIEAKNN